MIRRAVKAGVILAAFLAAALAGYLTSAELGQQLLKAEAEKQLSALLRGPVKIRRVRLALQGGLFLEGEDVGAYPSDSPPHAARLFARSVSAEIDVTALLAGRFGLSGLVLRDVDFRIRRDPQGKWEPALLEALADRSQTVQPDPMDRHLAFLGAFEAVARTLLSRVILADRFEVQNGRVILVDEKPPVSTPDAQPIRISLDQINGRIVHHWLSGVVDLRMTTNLVGAEDRKVPLRAEGMHNGGGDLQLDLNVRDLPLDLFEPYIPLNSGRVKVSGRWGGRIHYETHRLKYGSLTVDGAFSNLDVSIPVENGSIKTAHRKLRLSTHIEIDPDEARIGPATIETENAVVSLQGSVDRPLSDEARLQLSSEITGLDLDGLRTAMRSLPKEDSDMLENFLARAENGLIKRVRGSGEATLADWEQLLSGQLPRLLPQFTVSADLSDVRLRTREDGALSGLAGTIEVSEDRVSFLNLSGRLNGAPLPTFNIRIHEFSNLLTAPEAARVMRSRPPGLAGIRPFFALFEKDPVSATTPTIRPDVILKIDALEYPVLRWPIRDARVRISPIPGGSSIDIESGTWAGVPFQGYALWTHETSDVLDIDIWTRSYQEPAPTEAEPVASETGADEARPAQSQSTLPAWASGRFELPRLTFLRLPLANARGFFRLQEQDLELLQIRADIEPTGKLLASGSINLGRPEAVPIDFKFSIVSGDLSLIGESAGLSPEYATGRLHLSGELEGVLRPQTPLLADLKGNLRLDAREGELRRSKLPLLVALAHASEGYNEYAQRDSIAYESMTTQLDIVDGRISIRDFELEGPLRIYASGTLDVTRPPNQMIGVVGLFLFRGAGQFMETIPLVKAVLPGSERGLVGAYYQIEGTFDHPEVEPLTGKSVAEDLPNVLVAPYAVLNAILTGRELNEGQTEPALAPAAIEAAEIPSPPLQAAKPDGGEAPNDDEVDSGGDETPNSIRPESETLAPEAVIQQEPTDGTKEISP